MDIENAKAQDATHVLLCVHCFGKNRTHYHMPCIPLGHTKAGNLKVLVFGRLFWPDDQGTRRIRYVKPDRVTLRR